LFSQVPFADRGEVPEWPKGAVCKTAGSAFGGSNPPLSICTEIPLVGLVKEYGVCMKEFVFAGIAQLVEHQPSKLRVAGSSPVSRFVGLVAHVAQAVEHFLGKEEVTGSNPVVGF
jgi:hypothetical protein